MWSETQSPAQATEVKWLKAGLRGGAWIGGGASGPLVRLHHRMNQLQLSCTLFSRVSPAAHSSLLSWPGSLAPGPQPPSFCGTPSSRPALSGSTR